MKIYVAKKETATPVDCMKKLHRATLGLLVIAAVMVFFAACEPEINKPSKPGAPTISSVTIDKKGEITLKITPPGDNGGAPITEYEVQSKNARSTSAKEEGRQTVKPAGIKKVVMSGLQPDHEYTFTATATNSVGTSARSKAVTRRPVTAPHAPKISATPGNGKVTLKITKPYDGQSPITGYEVTVDPAPDSGEFAASGTKDITPNEINSVVVDGLTNGAEYTFMVTATNKKGTSDPGTVTATPSAATKPGVPTAVKKKTGATTSITITWDVPSAGKNAIGEPISQDLLTYEVRYKEQSSQEDWKNLKIYTATSATYTADTLNPGTEYQFRVRAINDNNDTQVNASDWSKIASISTDLYGSAWDEAPQPEGSARFSARSGHTSVALGDKMWVIGGNSKPGFGGALNDVWSSSDGGVTWTPVLPNNPKDTERFSARSGHTGVVFRDLKDSQEKILVIGGIGGGRLNDVWSSSDGGVTWKQVPQSGGSARFSARSGHTGVAHDGTIWVIGGNSKPDSGGALNDVWSSSDGGVTWTPVLPNNPNDTKRFSARYGHTGVAYDGKIWVIGGYDGSSRFNDVWSSKDGGVTWKQVPQSGGSARFSARDGHTGVAHDGKIWVIGGYDGSSDLNDVWSSSDGGVTWKQVPQSGGSARFSARYGHTSVVSNNRIWVIGGGYVSDGYVGAAFLNDVWFTR